MIKNEPDGNSVRGRRRPTHIRCNQKMYRKSDAIFPYLHQKNLIPRLHKVRGANGYTTGLAEVLGIIDMCDFRTPRPSKKGRFIVTIKDERRKDDK